MGAIVNFLVDNFIFVVFVAIILVLALIGYIVDSTKTAKLKKEFEKGLEDESMDIPIANIDANIKIGDHVNKMAMNGNASVNGESAEMTATTVEEAPKLGTLNK